MRFDWQWYGNIIKQTPQLSSDFNSDFWLFPELSLHDVTYLASYSKSKRSRGTEVKLIVNQPCCESDSTDFLSRRMKGLLFIAAVLCGTEKGGQPVTFMYPVVYTAQTIPVWRNLADVNHCLWQTETVRGYWSVSTCVCVCVFWNWKEACVRSISVKNLTIYLGKY